jgi:hypothetical protein
MLNRRQMLIVGAGSLVSSLALQEAVLAADESKTIFGGWVKTPGMGRYAQRFGNVAAPLLGTSEGKASLLWPYYEKAIGGPVKPFYQTIGDCCGEAGVMGAQFVSGIQIAHKRRPEEYKGPFVVEYTYAASRVEVGQSRIRRGDGSSGEWTAESLKRYGLLRRAKYGKYDLTKYDGNLGREWGRPGVGVPNELEPIGKEHPIKSVALVTTWDQAADSVSNGYPVLLCSSVGYSGRFDREGFQRHNQIWYHAMLLIGIDRRKGKRQGGCILNSWGPDWSDNSVPHELGAPSGAFWADSFSIHKALQEQDSYALSEFVGFRKQNLDYNLY